MNKSQLKYTSSHEWVAIEGEFATVGITDFAVKSLTDLVFIELPEVGKTVKAGESFGEIESVKAVSDLASPVSGEITEINSDLAGDLDILADDPYEKGWMIKLRLSGPVPSDLLDLAAYEQQCSEEH